MAGFVPPPVRSYRVATEPLDYHLVHRGGREGWWRPVLGMVTLLVLMFLVAQLVWTIPFMVGFALAGEPVAESLTSMVDFTDPTPLGLLFLNLVLGTAIPIAWLVSYAFHGLKPRWLSSVLPRLRWRYLLVCLALSVAALVAMVLVSLLLPAEADSASTGELNEFTSRHEIRSILEKQKNRDPLETEIRDLLSQLQIKEAAQQALAVQVKELGYNETAYKKAENEVTELEKIQVRFNILGKKIAHGAALKTQVAELGTRILQKQGELGQLKVLIDQSDYNPEIGARLEQTLTGIDDALRTAEAEIARTTERLRNTEEKIGLYKKDEEVITGLKKRITVLGEEIDLLKLTRSLIGEYVLYLLQVVRSRIEGEVSRIISEITGGRYEQVLLDEDFNLLIRDIDNDYPIDRFSGGEQDDIAVALRIALSRYLAELHQVHESTLLIFDEIFGSQDEERRTNLLAALRTQESRFPQIILISHIPDIQGEFSNTLMVEMGTDLSSRVQEVT